MTETQEDRARAFATAQTDAMAAYCNAEHDLKEARAENAGLREDLEFERSENGWAREFLDRMGPKCGTKDCPSLVAYVNKLESENAKLRQLAAYCHALLQCVCDGQDEHGEGCPLWADHGGECDLREVERRMRELGVEI